MAPSAVRDDGAPSTSEDDRRHMRRALALAKRGYAQVFPNPMVGAVVVRDGVVAGEGWHARFGEAHAEVIALAAAGERARGATLYVTLEPCAHTGKTPPCTDAVLRAGVSRVVIAVRDPNPQAGGGAARLRDAGVQVTTGVEAEAVRELLAPFMARFAWDRPWVTLKLALSLDGAIADHTRRPGWLTGKAARREVHRLRAGADAVAVGVGTACADDPLLTVRGERAPRVSPRRVVFDRSARLPLASRLVATARDVPTIVVTAQPESQAARALARAGVKIVAAPDLTAGMKALASHGIHNLLVEGGAALAGALLGDGLVDRLIIFQAPLLLGSGALPAFATAPAVRAEEARRLPVIERRRFGDDLMSVYALHQPPDPDQVAGSPSQPATI